MGKKQKKKRKKKARERAAAKAGERKARKEQADAQRKAEEAREAAREEARHRWAPFFYPAATVGFILCAVGLCVFVIDGFSWSWRGLAGVYLVWLGLLVVALLSAAAGVPKEKWKRFVIPAIITGIALTATGLLFFISGSDYPAWHVVGGVALTPANVLLVLFVWYKAGLLPAYRGIGAPYHETDGFFVGEGCSSCSSCGGCGGCSGCGGCGS